MPLKFYIAPFRFYSKQGEDYKYKDMVLRALAEWQKVSGGKVNFAIVNSLMESQINLDWKRVDRQALGHCLFNFDGSGRFYSAEVQIGISDGIIHQSYMAETEVYHTILHEIGHALGLGHSPYKNDIMYTPHEYGLVNLSEHDKETLRWLYRFNTGDTPPEIAAKNGVTSSDIDLIVAHMIQNKTPSEFEKVKSSIENGINKDLLVEQERIADLKKYNMALQNIQIPEDMKKFFINKNLEKK